jgi:hypothetical protein
MILSRGALGLQQASRLCPYGRVQAAVRLLRPWTIDLASRAASGVTPALRAVLVRAAAAAEPVARAANFAELGLGDGLQAGLASNNISQPTEIQVGSYASGATYAAARTEQHVEKCECCERPGVIGPRFVRAVMPESQSSIPSWRQSRTMPQHAHARWSTTGGCAPRPAFAHRQCLCPPSSAAATSW